jgi:hypothetical protein
MYVEEERREAKVSTSSPVFTAASTYAIPSAKVNATSGKRSSLLHDEKRWK